MAKKIGWFGGSFGEFETLFPRSIWLICIFAMYLAGCESRAVQASKANETAQAALAAGDFWTARVALTEATSKRDDVSEYWVSLGGINYTLERYPDAFYAYSRAVELDRGNVRALQALAELSLLNGQSDDAARFAQQLELLQPGSPAVLAVKGYAALAGGRYDDALARSDDVVKALPGDEGATILRARALEGLGRPREGIALLEAFVLGPGRSANALQTLRGIYEREDDATGVRRTLARQAALQPENRTIAVAYIRALYQAGARAEARQLLRKHADALTDDELVAMLSALLRHERSADADAEAEKLLVSAPPKRRMQVARYFIEAGKPDRALELIDPSWVAETTADTVNIVAIAGQASAAKGNLLKARRLFDTVLARDPANVLALRGRTDLNLAEQRPVDAVTDALRLVREAPLSAPDRLRLASAYRAAGNRTLREKTYWDAFNEIRANALLYRTLRGYLIAERKPDAAGRLDLEYKRQRFDTRRAVG